MIGILLLHDTLYTVDVEKNLIGTILIKEIQTIHISPDDQWEDKLQSLKKDKEVAVVFSDTHTYIHRFSIPSDTSQKVVHDLILSKAKEIIPEKVEHLVYDYKTIQQNTSLFVALSFSYAKSIVDPLYKKQFYISLGIPESVALFQILKSSIKKNEIVGYLNIGQTSSILTLFDEYGPLFSFEEAIETAQLKEGLKKAFTYFEKKYAHPVSRIIIDGKNSLNIDYEAMEDILQDRELLHMDKITQNAYTSSHIEFKSGAASRTLPPALAGMVLLYYEKNTLNLLHKNNIDHIRTQSVYPSQKQSETIHTFLDPSRVPTITIDNPFPKKNSKKTHQSRLIIMLLILAILIVILIGLVYYKYAYKAQHKAINQAPSPSVERKKPTPTPSPSPALDRADLTIQVLNGTGKAGVASEAQELLEKKGYTSIETGNADNFDYAQTIIQIKKDKQSYLPLLIKDLEETYTIRRDEAFLAPDQEEDAIVIIGNE